MSTDTVTKHETAATTFADPDDAPEWSDEVLGRAELKEGDEVLRPAAGTLTQNATLSEREALEAAKLSEIISDDEITKVHGHANFGTMSPREVVNDGVRKTAVGYHCGHTQFTILREHGLITRPKTGSYDANLTKKGKAYARGLYHISPPAQPSTVTAEAVALTVWYGEMPESNGLRNWTAMLCRKDAAGFDRFTQGFVFARSEYPDRVRYEADRMSWLIGEKADEPDLLSYDADLHSGYVAPPATSPVTPEEEIARIKQAIDAGDATAVCFYDSHTREDRFASLIKACRQANVRGVVVMSREVLAADLEAVASPVTEAVPWREQDVVSSIKELEAWDEAGLPLDEIKNWMSFGESVSCVLGQLKYLRAQADANVVVDALTKAEDRGRIAEVLNDGSGFWRACSGCQEGEDGHVSERDYPFNGTFRCQPGGGCSECGGLGVIWDDTDYGDMADAMLADDSRDEALEDLARAALGFIPPNLCTDNLNVGDDVVVPIDASMGELRALKAAALAAQKAEG